MLSNDKITEIYFIIDEFSKKFDKTITAHSLNEKEVQKKRNRKFMMTNSEVMAILVLFHAMGYKNLKHFYLFYIGKHLKKRVSRPCFVQQICGASKKKPLCQWLCF